VAVADATAAGRDPRVLGELLIGRLRDAFLAVMGAPDRHLPESDLQRAAELGESLGAAGLTRALEVVGEALVELAKKPDPRIVLEVALVRLCRPDADRSLDALLDRIERLERSVAAGVPSAEQPAGVAAAVHAAATHAGPGADARAELARARSGAAAPAAPGKVREPVKKAAAPRAPAGAAAPVAGSTAPPPPAPAAVAAGVDGPAASTVPAPAPASPTESAPAAPIGGSTTPAPAPAPSEPLEAAQVTAQWAAALATLKPSARAPFDDARIDSVSGHEVVVAIPPGLVRTCEGRKADIESALASSLGRRLSIRLVGDDALRSGAGSAATPGNPGGSPGTAPAAPGEAGDDEEEILDVHALDDAPTAVTGAARLAEAFPGAELIEEP
jgi:DNA polymerase-3 subunit gamma/tau